MANKMAEKKKNVSSDRMVEPKAQTTEKKKNVSSDQMVEPKAQTSEKVKNASSDRMVAAKAQTSEKVKVQAKEVKAVARDSRAAPPSRRDKRPSALARLFNTPAGRFVRESYYELRYKVTWPSFIDARNMTFAVIVLSLAVGLLLGLADLGLFQLFKVLTGS
ncbi:MAG: preprotein translocase subunit SecE [Ktedonobacteraceae bacterium]|nr:preprotein translocase subunit SecE [Chloroflexota bacterium]